MSNGIQITIPDFDDDDVRSTPTPFGRSAFGFGGGGGGFGISGLDSPSITTPISAFQSSERSYFSHSRADSGASIDSAGSATTRFASKPGTPYSHSAQPSTSTAFSKKPSFASIRNAFKVGKGHNEPPPMPSLEYPVLKNPFNRSTSSLNKQPTPTSARPSTPGRSQVTKSRHGPSKSSGSIFHNSDTGSDYGQPYIPEPPPVPRVPSAYGNMYREDSTYDVEDDKVVMDLKTPSDYALHAVFIRFVSLAEGKIDTFLREPMDQETQLPKYMGPGVDVKFDETLHSLGIIAQKHAKKVIDSIMRWRRSQQESVSEEMIRFQMERTTQLVRSHEVPNLLNERKSLAAIYIMCRALISILQLLSKDALGDALGFNLEETTFEQFRKPDRKSLTLSANHRINSELYATLLGHLANVRFISVTDRFLAELVPVSLGQVPKDLATKYENLVKGLKHIKIKVWPPEAFEEGAEFMEALSKSYANAHGHLKIAFAETLIMLLHPIGKTAQAETNNPQWGKAIELIYPKAREMMSKPRYWQIAFPLAITSLCVAPQTFFLKHWQSFFESSISKLKEKPYRVIVMNGLLRLVWTYLYRCQESASTTMTKLENLLKNFFPSNRTTVFPSDEHLEPLMYMIHFILSRHPEYGRDLCLELVQEPVITTIQAKSGSIGSVLAHERTAIAINAILLSYHNTEREILTPTWPSTTDFSVMPPKSDYASSSQYINSTTLKPGMREFLDRAAAALASIAIYCGNSVGRMSVFDDQWAYSRLTTANFDEPNNYVIKRHAGDIVTAYPVQCSSHISLLQTCFQAWPRLLHPSIVLSDAIDMLLRGVIHVEPMLADAATAAVKRFMDDDDSSLQVISEFNKFLFSPSRICHETGLKLHVEYSPLLRLWVEVVDNWIQHLVQRGIDSFPQTDQIFAKCTEFEAAALFLLSHESSMIQSTGVRVVRLLNTLLKHISSSNNHSGILHVVARLQEGSNGNPCLQGFDSLLDKSEQSRLEQWRKLKAEEVLLRIADSPNEKDRKLWRYVYPILLQNCQKQSGSTLGLLREGIVASVSRYHPSISFLGGLSIKMPLGFPSRTTERDGQKLLLEHKVYVDQWHIWVKVLCATATPPDSSRPALTKLGRDHNRAPSDISFERERYFTTRGLFRHLTPFLDSEYTLFRDAAVLCISSFPPNAYPALLEDLSLLAGRQAYEDPRSKLVTTPSLEQSFGLLASRQAYEDNRSRSGSTSMLTERSRRQERLHAAVARIYSLTVHLLQQQRSSARQAALANILKFVRNTQAYLTSPEMLENPSLHRLRRYFCGIIEQLFNELATLKDSDRFIPSHMHLSLYRLCEDWCQIGPQSETAKRRLGAMQRLVEGDSSTSRENGQKFRHESALLSHASVGALMALCTKAFFPPDQAASSPTEHFPPDFTRPLSVLGVLDRLSAVMTSSHVPNQEKGKDALRSLAIHSDSNLELIYEILRRAIVVTDKTDTSNYRFFEALADIVAEENHQFTFVQMVCLGLTNLRHPSATVRYRAFTMLESIHQQNSGLLTMSTFEPLIASMSSSTYIHATRLIADFLAGEHPNQAVSILAQLGNWLPQLPGEAYDTNVILLLLQSLEFWIPNINLMTDDITTVSRKGSSCLYHLTSLTLRYGQSHAEQILVLWTKLMDSPQKSNAHATVRFLLEQAHKVGNTLFVTCAANIVASLCQTHIGRQVFEELCSVIEPAHMLPNLEHKLHFPEAEDMKLWEDLDALFADQPRLSLGSAQFAWLFLSDVALQRYWEQATELPTLLHAVLTHLDHRHPFIRDRAHAMLFQLLRSWTPGYDELPERSTGRSRLSIKDSIAVLEREASDLYWHEEDSSEEAVPKMEALCRRVIAFLEPLAPHLVSQWGSLALTWGTTCSIRATAFRSLQIFRALMPRVKKADFALLLGRLSNTVASSEENIQAFTSEIFLTINAVAKSGDVDKSLIPQIFWCTCACLSTTVEDEFSQTVDLLNSLITKLDFNDSATIEALLSHQPVGWNGSPYLQPDLLRGLCSSVTSTATMKVLQALVKIQDARLIDPSEGRLRDLYTVSLPWCLHAMDRPENSMKTFAEDIAAIAAKEKRPSIQKIMNSFAKSHFRTRDDFLRQSVASLREHYGAQNWTEIVTLLIGLVLNSEHWLRIHAMQVLKVLFQHRETRNPVELLGSELLMPLLRLLETDLAPQALDVLEEPMAMSGIGPAAKHVLRMSMHFGSLPPPATAANESDPESVTTIFGVPQESGWCVAQAEVLRERCQQNVMAVFDTCSVPTRPSRIDFEPEVEALASIKTPLADDLGGLVKNLHEISSFLSDDPSLKSVPLAANGGGGASPSPNPTRRVEARVAAILAKSTNPDSISDTPQTPFLDVFNVGGMYGGNGEDSDEYSDSDSDTDAFIFDSLHFGQNNTNGHTGGYGYPAAVNGMRYG